jgi:ABC-type multidrug transport system fused ATPase/permease subunit
MISFITWICVALSILGLYIFFSQKFKAKVQEENKKLEQRQSEISRELSLIDSKKKEYEEDFKEISLILKGKVNYINEFHDETLAIIDNDKISKQELVNQNDFLKKQNTKLKTDLHNARQRSKRLAKNTVNTV